MENRDYLVECHVCGKDFDMTWGQEDSICDGCKTAVNAAKEDEYDPNLDDSLCTMRRKDLATLLAIADFYADAKNWYTQTVEGLDGDGREITQDLYYGDGGEFARRHLE